MIKFTSNTDYDFGIESVEVITDSRQLTKRASAKEQLKFERTPNQTDLHIIALGAYEGTGCFFEGAPVQTFDGIKPIETVQVGDLVLTDKGRYRKVLTTFKEEYEGPAVTLDISNLCDPIVSTANHPYKVIKAEDFTPGDRCPCFLNGEEPKDLLEEIIEKKAQYVAAKDIVPGDYVLTPINISIDEVKEYTYDEAYLFGYYLSEGCLVREYKNCVSKGEFKSLLFTINTEGDRPIINFLQRFIEGCDRSFSMQKSLTSEVGGRIQFGHKVYAEEVDRLFGHHSTTKHIHPLIFTQSKEWKLKFLAAYFDGDGCLIPDDTNGNSRYIGTLTGSTASRNLAYDVHRLLASCGISSTIYKGMNKKSNGCFGTCDHVIYQVNIGGSQSGEVLQHCLRHAPVDKEFKMRVARCWPSHNYLVYKVKKVETSEVTNEIKYNLEVEEDNTFVVDISAHNSNRNLDCYLEDDCRKYHHTFVKAGRAVHRQHKNKPTDPKYGNIKASAYNEPMKRIELIVGLDNDKCADLLTDLEKTGSLSFSMASSQKFDECSFCHHRAKDDQSRCSHIPDKLGEIREDGEICRMINPQPKWIEISHVKRGADRIALSLKKLASDSTLKPMLTSDYLKIYDGFVPPEDELYISKKASEKRSLLEKLAAMEKRVEAISHRPKNVGKDLFIARHAKALNKTESLSKETIDELRKFDPHKLLRALADNGIVLNPDEFAKYTFGDRVKDENVEGMKSHLPGAFQDLDKDPQAKGEVANSEHFSPSPLDIIPKEMKDLVSKLVQGHSMFGKPAAHRVMRVIIMSGDGDMDKPVQDKEKTKEAFDKELAKQYLSYKTSAINYMEEKGKLDEDTMMNCVIQNLR